MPIPPNFTAGGLLLTLVKIKEQPHRWLYHYVDDFGQPHIKTVMKEKNYFISCLKNKNVPS